MAPEVCSTAASLNWDLNPERRTGDVGPEIRQIFPEDKLLRDRVTSRLLLRKRRRQRNPLEQILNTALLLSLLPHTQLASPPTSKTLHTAMVFFLFSHVSQATSKVKSWLKFSLRKKRRQRKMKVIAEGDRSLKYPFLKFIPNEEEKTLL